jgi:multiple sugar transport system substrate-binding protein
MLKRKVALVMVIIVALTMGVWAGGSSEKAAAPAATPASPQTFNVWLGSWWQPAVADIEARFAKDNPGYIAKIQLQPVNNYLDNATTAIVGGTPPEALDLDSLMIPTPISKGLLKPLDDFMARYNIKAGDFVQGAYISGVANGKVYAIPDRAAVTVMMYNKTLFDKAGVPYPTNSMTLDQLVDTAKKLTIPGKQYGWGIAATNSDPANVMTSFCPILFSFGGNFLNADMTKATLSEPAGVNAIKYYIDLYRTYKVVPEGTLNYAITRDLVPMLQNGTLAMCPMNDSNLAPSIDAMKKNGFDWGLAFLPGGGLSRMGCWSFTIPATSRNVPAAEKWIAWFTKAENQGKQNIVMPGTPASKGMGSIWDDPKYNIFWEVMKVAKPVPPTPRWTEIQNLTVIGLQKGLQGTMTPEALAADLDSQINALLK